MFKKIYLSICAGLLLFGLLSFTFEVKTISKNPRTDGVYESAIRKMESGRELDEREKKRIDDVLRFSEKN